LEKGRGGGQYTSVHPKQALEIDDARAGNTGREISSKRDLLQNKKGDKE
jgi:hypothetical protein